MRRNRGLAAVLVLCTLMNRPSFAAQAKPTEQQWPLRIEGGRAPIVLYEPQPETLKDDKLTARAAVSVQPKNQSPVFGAVWFEARVTTDRKARTVTVEEVQVPRARFAGSTPEKEQMLSQILAAELAKRKFVISL